MQAPPACLSATAHSSADTAAVEAAVVFWEATHHSPRESTTNALLMTRLEFAVAVITIITLITQSGAIDINVETYVACCLIRFVVKLKKLRC